MHTTIHYAIMMGTIVKYCIMLISKNKNIIINDTTIPMICYVGTTVVYVSAL